VKPLSASQINQLRVLLKKSARPPIDKDAQRAARRITDAARREAYRATVLAWSISDWDASAARLREKCPGVCVELGIGERPSMYTPKLASRYEARRKRFDSIST
jgi:hypothetical protein